MIDNRLYYRSEDMEFKIAPKDFNLYSRDVDSLYVDVTDKVKEYLCLKKS